LRTKIVCSGRIINIVVSAAAATGNLENSRLLNYLTAPNVVRLKHRLAISANDASLQLVWSAALASCAIPGVYAPVRSHLFVLADIDCC